MRVEPAAAELLEVARETILSEIAPSLPESRRYAALMAANALAIASRDLEKHGLKSVCYRPFSGYGEDQDDSYPFPSFCKRAIAHIGRPALTVWGTGEQMRDFIHIEDCVDGVLATMDKIDDGNALNLSTGRYTSFKQFARMAA